MKGQQKCKTNVGTKVTKVLKMWFGWKSNCPTRILFLYAVGSWKFFLCNVNASRCNAFLKNPEPFS